MSAFVQSGCCECRHDLQVLEVAARELVVGDNLNLAIAGLRDLDGLAEVAGAALDLDALVEELLESRDVEDLVAGGLRSVDDELFDAWLDWGSLGAPRCQSSSGEGGSLTFLVTLGPLALVDFFYNSQNDLAYCFTPWCRSQTKPLGSEAERALGQQQSVARCEHTATGAISSVEGCGIDECRESDGGRWTENAKR